LHYGRDALVGVALFLSLLTETNQKVSELRDSYPNYVMCKAKVSLSEEMNVDLILKKVEKKYSEKNPSTMDGIKIAFKSSWVHLRKSNTEPIIRVYTEAKNETKANELAQRFLREIEEMV
jgi:phosphomannomutase